MFESITSLIPYLVLFSHIAFGFLILAIIFRESWGKDIYNFLGKNANLFGFLISLLAIIGSLFYSEIVGFAPCVLCWWQRVFLYPLAVIFGVALWKKLPQVFLYAVPLALLAIVFAGYHSYTSLGGTSVLPCTAVGGECSKVYVKAFGYITIPFMSLTIAFYILLLSWINKLYRNENSNPQR